MISAEGEVRGDYGCIPKVSKQLGDLLECNNWLRLISFCMYEIQILMRCIMDFRNLIKFKTSKRIITP